jgi:23S rRNA (cytidine1920-2'-O)/16S rRNA (cytidine1409-2'-O)-methyltransferase
VSPVSTRAARVRLDQLIVDRGLAPSRTRAQALLLGGRVRVGDGDAARLDRKPGDLVDGGVAITVTEPEPYVSRGGYKLAAALDAFAIDPSGLVCLDVGASTGGFTDVLLQRRAARVYALDVGRGQLAEQLRADPRVVSLERTNARGLTAGTFPEPMRLAVIDVSFISLAKVLPAVLACSAPRRDVLAMIKPQFEVGRGNVGKGGVVRDPDDRRAALVAVAAAARGMGASVLGFASSGLPGPKGNRESFVWLAEAGRAGDVGDLDAAARVVEP